MKLAQLFQKKALDKMRSPEKLDLVLTVTTPTTWMALLAVGAFIISVILWSIFGSFTVKVDGMGLITDSAGVASVNVVAGGRVKEVYVHSGGRVKKGDLIARVEQPTQEAETRISRFGVGLSKNQQEAMGRVFEHDEKLFREQVTGEVNSPFDGIVGEILVPEGAVVNAGEAIASIRLTQNRGDLSGVFYVPVAQGKQIEPGMTIQLAPNGIDVSESGSLLGVVRSVSEFPSYRQTMLNDLGGNEQLVQFIATAQKGAVIRVQFDLIKDPNSSSGYLWTSVVGRHSTITPGSFVTGSVIVSRIPPIERVFYKLSQWLRSR